MSDGTRHLTEAPSPVNVPVSAFHSNLSCSTGVSSSLTVAVRDTSLLTSVRSVSTAIRSITGAAFAGGPAGGGPEGVGDGGIGVGLFDDPPHAATSTAARSPATIDRAVRSDTPQTLTTSSADDEAFASSTS